MQNRLATLAYCALCLIGLFSKSTNAEPFGEALSTKDNWVVLRRTVLANYSSSDLSSQDFEKLVYSSVPREVIVTSGTTLPKIVFDEYGIGQSKTPELYAKVEQKILETNEISSPEKLKPGSILIPDIPKHAKRQPSTNNPFLRIPKISVLENEKVSAVKAVSVNQQNSLVFKSRPIILDNLRVGAQAVNEIRHVPVEDALQIIEMWGTETPYAVDSAPLEVKLGKSSEPDKHRQILSEKAASVIKNALSQQAKSKPIVVILDDSWPDQASFKEARDFFIAATALVRERKKLGPTSLPKTLRDLNETNFDVSGHPELRLHSAMIKESLIEFQKLDSRSAVRVVYLPLIKAQLGATEILKELIQINIAAKLMGPDFGKISATQDVLNQAKSTAEIAVRRLDSVMSAAGTPTLGTDQAVVESVANFMKMHSEVAGEPFFLSLSWTVPNLKFQTYFMPPDYGLTITSAGNESGRNILKASTQFAARSTKPGDMLAVMNIDNDGHATCATSVLELDPTTDVYGFAFPGDVQPGICGTSFSAPRVAWLLAAREAVLTEKPSELTRYLWAPRLKTKLLSLQDKTKNDFRRFILAPEQLFTQTSSSQ